MGEMYRDHEHAKSLDEDYKNFLDAFIEKNADGEAVTHEIVKASRKEIKKVLKDNPGIGWQVLRLQTKLLQLRKVTPKKYWNILSNAYRTSSSDLYWNYKRRYGDIQEMKVTEANRATLMRDFILDYIDELQDKVRNDSQVKQSFTSPHLEEILAERMALDKEYPLSRHEDLFKDHIEDEDEDYEDFEE